MELNTPLGGGASGREGIRGWGRGGRVVGVGYGREDREGDGVARGTRESEAVDERRRAGV